MDHNKEKKSKMRTSSDVISRLLWDDSLPESEFVVGYLDRFVGTIEAPFTTLDWSDPSTVDNNTLALPKHRIQYFKYKSKKVWDKYLRLDFVFGSTGDMVDIHDFMKKIDEEEEFFCCEDEHVSSEEEVEKTSITYDNSDRPNFFIAARITDQEVLNNLDKVASSVKQGDPMLSDCCIGLNKYHSTLSTLRLDSPEEINDVMVALSDLQMQNISIPVIDIETLNVFHRRVLYACINENKQFLELRKAILNVLEEWKVKIVDKCTFVPHVTIAKTSRPVARARGSKYIDPSLYINHADDKFGSQTIDKIYLCEMGSSRRDDGFYMCAAEVNLSNR